MSETNVEKVVKDIELRLSFEDEDTSIDYDNISKLYECLKSAYEYGMVLIRKNFESSASFLNRCGFDENGNLISLNLSGLELKGDVDICSYAPKLETLKLDGNPDLKSIKVDKNSPVAVDFMALRNGLRIEGITPSEEEPTEFLYTEESLEALDETLSELENIMSETGRIVNETKPSVGVFIEREPTQEEAEIYVEELVRQYEALRIEIERLEKAITDVDASIHSLSEKVTENTNIAKETNEAIGRAAIGEIIANIMKRRLAAVEVGLFGKEIKELKSEFSVYDDNEKLQKLIDRIKEQVDDKNKTADLVYACLNNMHIISEVRGRNIESACAALCYDRALAINARNFGHKGVKVVRKLRRDYIRAERASNLDDPHEQALLRLLMNESAKLTRDITANYQIRNFYMQSKARGYEEKVAALDREIARQKNKEEIVNRRINDKISPTIETKSRYKTQSEEIHIKHLESVLGTNLDEKIENCGRIIKEGREKKKAAEAKAASTRKAIPTLKKVEGLLKHRKDGCKENMNKINSALAKRNKKR